MCDRPNPSLSALRLALGLFTATALLALLMGCGDIVIPGDGDADVVADADVTPDADVVADVTPDVPVTTVSCDDYCAIITQSCTGALEQYKGEAVCKLYCTTFGQLPLGTDQDQAGNTVGCRTYHATVAQVGMPELHCPHAGPTGGDVCGSWCVNYCHLAMLNCTGANSLYASQVDCLETCASFQVDGTPGDEFFDNVQCRINYLGLAGTEPLTTAPLNCPLAGLLSEKCVDETPTVCPTSESATSEGCLTCVALREAHEGFNDTASDLYGQCKVDDDCVKVSDDTDCVNTCGTAVAKAYQLQFLEFIDELGDQYCDHLDPSCIPGPATCSAVVTVPRCVLGECELAP